jgi:hypothetical protein
MRAHRKTPPLLSPLLKNKKFALFDPAYTVSTQASALENCNIIGIKSIGNTESAGLLVGRRSSILATVALINPPFEAGVNSIELAPAARLD